LLPKVPHTLDWLSLTFLLLTGLLAISAYTFSERFAAFLKRPFSSSYPVQHMILSRRGRDAFSTLMEFFFFPAAAVLILATVRVIGGVPLQSKDFIIFAQATLGLAFFFVLKSWLMNLYAVVFDASRPFEFYGFQYMTFRQWTLMWAFPIGVFMVYFPFETSLIGWLSAVVLITGFLIAWGLALIRLISVLGNLKLHFILYLCALEIGPLLIAVKWIIDW
jgi:hypothetical protein